MAANLAEKEIAGYRATLNPPQLEVLRWVGRSVSDEIADGVHGPASARAP